MLRDNVEKFSWRVDGGDIHECDFRMVNGVKYVPERTCKMEFRKSGPFYDVYYFPCCDKEWSEPRCDDHYTELPGTVCPWCGAKVVE